MAAGRLVGKCVLRLLLLLLLLPNRFDTPVHHVSNNSNSLFPLGVLPVDVYPSAGFVTIVRNS